MYKKIQETWGKINLISLGSLTILIGIVMSLFSISWANLAILFGTFLLGWGFYLRSESLPEKLSGYGQFMLGIATLITLPQAPEMLKHILRIEKAVEELQDGLKNINVATKTLDIISTGHMTYNTEAKYNPQRIENKKEDKQKIVEKIKSFTSRPLSTPHLNQKNANEIINTLNEKGFTKDNVESLLEKHLEVWDPQHDSLKSRKAE